MRVELARWDEFCAHMVGITWRSSRRELAKLRTAFELANVATPDLLTAHPNLSMLMRAMLTIIRKGAATKKANQQAVREGREPLRGTLRAARKAAEKAAYAEQQKKEAAKGNAKGGNKKQK